MEFKIDNYHLLLKNNEINIIKKHIYHSDIPIYIKHENINNTLWITNSLFKCIYNITLSDFENYYPSSTFQNEIKGLNTDIHSPIYRNNNIFFIDCKKIKYTQFEYVTKIFDYLIKSNSLSHLNNTVTKDILNLKDKLRNTKHKKTLNTQHNEITNSKIEYHTKNNNIINYNQIWILNPNYAIEQFLKHIEIYIQNYNDTNFIFVSPNNILKYKYIHKIITSSSIIKLKIDTNNLNYIFNESYIKSIIPLKNNIYQLFQNKLLPKLLLNLSKRLKNNIPVIRLSIILWLKNINYDSNNIKNIETRIDNNIDKYIYENILPYIPIFKISNTLFQNIGKVKTINPIISYYQISFSLLSIPNLLEELIFYIHCIITTYYKYSKYDCISNLNIDKKVNILKLLSNLQYESLHLDKPISELQYFFVNCIKIIKNYN